MYKKYYATAISGIPFALNTTKFRVQRFLLRLKAPEDEQGSKVKSLINNPEQSCLPRQVYSAQAGLPSLNNKYIKITNLRKSA